MRKVIESTLVSIDGVIGDPSAWASEYFGTEAEQAALEQLLDSDAMLMGRRTYEMFAAMSRTATGDYADRMNSIRKYVFSSTLEKADWTNTTIISGDPAAAVAGLKRHDGQPLVMYGHGPLGADAAGAPPPRRAPLHDPPRLRRRRNAAVPGDRQDTAAARRDKDPRHRGRCPQLPARAELIRAHPPSSSNTRSGRA